MRSTTFKGKVNKIYAVCSSLCPICDKKEIEGITIQSCGETDTLIDYDVLFHVVLAKLTECENCQSKEEIYEEY